MVGYSVGMAWRWGVIEGVTVVPSEVQVWDSRRK